MEEDPMFGLSAKVKKDKRTELKKNLINQITHNIISTEDLLDEYADIHKMMSEHKSNEPAFRQKYKEALDLYIGAKWEQAVKVFEE